MIEIELTCRLCREIEENPTPFTIKVPTSANINHLRKINDVTYIEHDHLELWKVEIVREYYAIYAETQFKRYTIFKEHIHVSLFFCNYRITLDKINA